MKNLNWIFIFAFLASLANAQAATSESAMMSCSLELKSMAINQSETPEKKKIIEEEEEEEEEEPDC